MNKQKKIQEKNIIRTDNSSIKWQNLEVGVLKKDSTPKGATEVYSGVHSTSNDVRY
jgi:hypothetical protein